MIFEKILKRKEHNKENKISVSIDSKPENDIVEVHKTISNVKNNDNFDAVHKLFEEATTNAMLSMPMWMRLNYFANTLVKDDKDTKVDWDKVNSFLMLGIDKKKPYYNIYGKIQSIEQLRKAASDAKVAFIPEFDMPFYKKRCKQCGNTFTLTLGEINSYENKGLKIPSRCYCCRKGIEKPVEKKIIQKEKEEPVKTEMQIALEKAGLC